MRQLRWLAPLCFALVLPACEFIPDRTLDYTRAQQLPPLSTGGVFDRSKLRDDWVVPEGERKALSEEKFELPPPPRALEDITAIKAAYRELGEDRWLAVSESPSRIWSAVSRYWAENGLRIVREQPDSGVMEVKVPRNAARALNWLDTLKLTDALPETWTVHIQNGLKRNSSEIRLDGPDGAAQKALLTALETWLAERNEESYSLRARQLDSKPRVKLLESEDGTAKLALYVDYDRGWFEVDQALAQAGIRVVDRDRSQGTWDVALKTRTIFERWLDRLKGLGDQPPADTRLRLIRGNDGLILQAEPLSSGQAGQERARRLIENVLEHLS
ncbi:outer membrane protein assembly factor BamC [Hahella sp. SMD15-11]|uniref:Outer membrane protein assembly factor BamC n=1 Tax=Thermohahella caldifontis TaxID=3142973 RepID=A0AB39UZ88_9GAMM